MKIIMLAIDRLLALPFVKKPRVLFLSHVHCVLGNLLLKLFFVEAYDNKVPQVCLVVFHLGSRAVVKFHTSYNFLV